MNHAKTELTKITTVLRTCPLFKGLGDTAITLLLERSKAIIKTYKKGSFIYEEGDALTSFGLVISGSVSVLTYDYWGNTNMISKLSSLQLFGEAFCAAGLSRIPVSVFVNEDSKVILIPYTSLFDTNLPKEIAQDIHQNMLHILANKNVYLAQSVEIISMQKTRDKLIAYLSYEAKRQKQETFEIPYNRNELADYLGVDRSAMSSSLSKLKQEGYIDYHKNFFALRKPFEGE